MMKVVNINYTRESEPKNKPMAEMVDGEIGYWEETNDYILCIGNERLILNDNDTVNYYVNGGDNTVRELYDGETITIEFSKTPVKAQHNDQPIGITLPNYLSGRKEMVTMTVPSSPSTVEFNSNWIAGYLWRNGKIVDCDVGITEAHGDCDKCKHQEGCEW